VQQRRGRRTVAGAVALVAAAVILVAARDHAPPGAIPPIWPTPVTVLAALALATATHAAVTGRLRPNRVSATTAVVLLAVLATAPTFDYTWHSPSAPYFVVGLGALPAALGAAVKSREPRLTAALAGAALLVAVAGGAVNGGWSVPEFVGVHAAATLPAAAIGYALTAPGPET